MKINVLDCTLRDGGYVNDWSFDHVSIPFIIKGLLNANVNLIELGFLRNNKTKDQTSVFANIAEANSVIMNLNPANFCVMIEAFNPYDLSKLPDASKSNIKKIRVCIWKRYLKEHVAYCKEIIKKGYSITIQPSRVEQYSDDEFVQMLECANSINPFALYIVDTWGTQNPSQIVHYAKLADQYLDKSIAIGYHGHNNMMQALACCFAFINLQIDRNIYIDSSLFGIGRGAGNLNTEILLKNLNDNFACNFSYIHLIPLISEHIVPIKEKNDDWGYSLYSFLAADNNINPNYGMYFKTNNISIDIFISFINSLSEQEKIVFSDSFVNERLKALSNDKS